VPDADGFEFLEVFRKNESWQDVPVIVLTALDLDEHELAKLNVYVESVLRKTLNNQRSTMTQNGWFVAFIFIKGILFWQKYCWLKIMK
jgi:CheY-like chemotaxis protein